MKLLAKKWSTLLRLQDYSIEKSGVISSNIYDRITHLLDKIEKRIDQSNYSYDDLCEYLENNSSMIK